MGKNNDPFTLIPSRVSGILRNQKPHIDNKRFNKTLYAFDAFDSDLGTGYSFQEDFFNAVLGADSGTEFNIQLRPTKTLPSYKLDGMWGGSETLNETDQTNLPIGMLSKNRKKFILREDLDFDNRLIFFAEVDIFGSPSLNPQVKDVKFYVRDDLKDTFHNDVKTSNTLRLLEVVSWKFQKQNGTDTNKRDYITFNWFKKPIQPINVKKVILSYKSKPFIQRIQFYNEVGAPIKYKINWEKSSGWLNQPYLNITQGRSVVLIPAFTNEYMLNYVLYYNYGNYWSISEAQTFYDKTNDVGAFPGIVGINTLFFDGIPNQLYLYISRVWSFSMGGNMESFFNTWGKAIAQGSIKKGVGAMGTSFGPWESQGVNYFPNWSARSDRFWNSVGDNIFQIDIAYHHNVIFTMSETGIFHSGISLNKWEQHKDNISEDMKDKDKYYAFSPKHLEDMGRLLQGELIWNGETWDKQWEDVLSTSSNVDFNEPYNWDKDEVKRSMCLSPWTHTIGSNENFSGNPYSSISTKQVVQKSSEVFIVEGSFGQKGYLTMTKPNYYMSSQLTEPFYTDTDNWYTLFIEFENVANTISQIVKRYFDGYEYILTFLDENGDLIKVDVDGEEFRILPMKRKAVNRKGEPRAVVEPINFGTGGSQFRDDIAFMEDVKETLRSENRRRIKKGKKKKYYDIDNLYGEVKVEKKKK